MTAEQFPHRCPEIYLRLKKIDAEIAGGSAALVALIVNNRLYVANVGTYKFLPWDAMCTCGLCHHALSVCLSRSCILSKRVNISSKFFTAA